MVNFFAFQYGKDCLVVRFNGGAQSSHTVVMPDGRRHVFAHIGSGSFQGAATYLSSFFVCNPILFLREMEDLKTKGIEPILYVHPGSYITTPYDMMINQWIEEHRGEARHGSCGIGFGETIERAENWGISLTVGDLSNKDYLIQTFDEILGAYMPHRLGKLGIEITVDQARLASSDDLRNRFIEDCGQFLQRVHVVSNNILNPFDTVIFEGAQGLLLDQGSRFFPHVTRSNTGLKNVLSLVRYARVNSLETTYVMRAYTTRHGAGPLPHELSCSPYARVIDETNIANAHQGSLRFSWLNLDLLREALRYDSWRSPVDTYPLAVTRQLAITCMDQVDEEVKYIIDGEVRTTTRDELPSLVSAICQMPVRYLSFSPVAPIDNNFLSGGLRSVEQFG